MAGKSQHLIGAYGMFWNRETVDWRPSSGPQAWQLLGHRGTNLPGLRLCDFRRAQGFYILFDDHRASYVGLARGRDGLGSRLRTHHMDTKKRWSRFCWFAFDDVTDDAELGWSKVVRRDAVRSVSAETILRECEALIILALGSQDQNQMRFQAAAEWKQVGESQMGPGQVGRKVSAKPLTDRWLLSIRNSEL